MSNNSSSSQEANGQEIYNLLLAGHRIQLPFPSLLEARAFRNYIATIKSRQDKIAIGCGLYTEEEAGSLLSSLLTGDSEEVKEVKLVLAISTEKRQKLFTYEILSSGVEANTKTEAKNEGAGNDSNNSSLSSS